MNRKWAIVNWPCSWDGDGENPHKELICKVIARLVRAGFVPCVPQATDTGEERSDYPPHLFVSGEVAARETNLANRLPASNCYADGPLGAWVRTFASIRRACIFVAIGPLERDQTLLIHVAEHYRVLTVVYCPGAKPSAWFNQYLEVAGTLDQLYDALMAHEACAVACPLIGEE